MTDRWTPALIFTFTGLGLMPLMTIICLIESAPIIETIGLTIATPIVFALFGIWLSVLTYGLDAADRYLR